MKEQIIKLSSPERYFTRFYHDFMDCDWLSGEEKIIFLSLKRFLDVRSNAGKVFPTIETIQRMTKWGKQKVSKYLKSLECKGILKRIRQGLGKPNIYLLSDSPNMWTCEETEDVSEMTNDKNTLSAEEHIAELKKMGYKIKIEKEVEEDVKEKELVSGSDQTTDTNSNINNNTKNCNTNKTESQYPKDKEYYQASKTDQTSNANTNKTESQKQDSMSNADADALLDRLWALYPIKKGKGRISAKQKKVLLKIGYDEMERAIHRYKKYVNSIDFLHYQNGSTFFNEGYVDYLDANYDPESDRKAKCSSETKQKKNRFTDYPHREYDFDAIKRTMFLQ